MKPDKKLPIFSTQIKCDNEDCDFKTNREEKTLDFSNPEYKTYLIEKLLFVQKFIDVPCPKCASVLLTRSDYENYQKGIYGIYMLDYPNESNEKEDGVEYQKVVITSKDKLSVTIQDMQNNVLKKLI